MTHCVPKAGVIDVKVSIVLLAPVSRALRSTGQLLPTEIQVARHHPGLLPGAHTDVTSKPHVRGSTHPAFTHSFTYSTNLHRALSVLQTPSQHWGHNR